MSQPGAGLSVVSGLQGTAQPRSLLEGNQGERPSPLWAREMPVSHSRGRAAGCLKPGLTVQ